MKAKTDGEGVGNNGEHSLEKLTREDEQRYRDIIEIDCSRVLINFIFLFRQLFGSCFLLPHQAHVIIAQSKGRGSGPPFQ